MIRTFTRAWRTPSTRRARSFYLVVGRYFLVLGIGERHLTAPLIKTTNDAR
jgi:hypothetical protein